MGKIIGVSIGLLSAVASSLATSATTTAAAMESTSEDVWVATKATTVAIVKATAEAIVKATTVAAAKAATKAPAKAAAKAAKVGPKYSRKDLVDIYPAKGRAAWAHGLLVVLAQIVASALFRVGKHRVRFADDLELCLDFLLLLRAGICVAVRVPFEREFAICAANLLVCCCPRDLKNLSKAL